MDGWQVGRTACIKLSQSFIEPKEILIEMNVVM